MLSHLLALKNYVMSVPAEEAHTIYGRNLSGNNGRSPLFSQELFTTLLALERKRAERSRQPFALMLVDATRPLRTDRRDHVFAQLLVGLSSSIRETDIWGWHKEGSVIGVILTEVGAADADTLRTTMLSKVSSALRAKLRPEEMKDIRISIHVFPEEQGFRSDNIGSGDTALELYPDLDADVPGKRTAKTVKRAFDIAASAAALILLAPVLLAIAAAIKLTSKGPVLFKQKRVGQYGKEFMFLKFRSMNDGNDAKIHRDYVRRLIAGKADCRLADGNGGAYKLQDDPRITRLGKFLRRSSLDELPQFWNVLRGDMSIVGPRPPIPYETQVYDVWHRRRFFEVRPGITGLWQVTGRSRVTFDDMVRLDIHYMQHWSLGLDLKILLQTPRAVFAGKGAH